MNQCKKNVTQGNSCTNDVLLGNLKGKFKEPIIERISALYPITNIIPDLFSSIPQLIKSSFKYIKSQVFPVKFKHIEIPLDSSNGNQLRSSDVLNMYWKTMSENRGVMDE